jgi:glycosyltransferase involved in cell wall biosynthesis
MKLSIITTLYYSAPYIEEFYRRSIAAAEQITSDIEIVIVNDGSPDNALELARKLVKQDARVVVVDLARNFGHHRAIMTGLAYTTGDYVFLIDCDLEEVPETLPAFFTALHADPEADVVYSVQNKRQGPLLRRLPGDFYYRLVNYLSDYDVPRNILMTRLMSQRYVKALLEHREQLFSIEGLWETNPDSHRKDLQGKQHLQFQQKTLAGNLFRHSDEQQTPYRHFLPGLDDYFAFITRYSGADYSTPDGLHRCRRLDIHAGFVMVSGRADYFHSGHHRYLHLRHLHGNQAAPLHHRA